RGHRTCDARPTGCGHHTDDAHRTEDGGLGTDGRPGCGCERHMNDARATEIGGPASSGQEEDEHGAREDEYWQQGKGVSPTAGQRAVSGGNDCITTGTRRDRVDTVDAGWEVTLPAVTVTIRTTLARLAAVTIRTTLA